VEAQASDPPKMIPHLTERYMPTLFNPLGVAVFIVAFMTRGFWPIRITRACAGSRNGTTSKYLCHPARPGGVATKFTANDIDLHNRLVSKRSVQNQHVGAG
jgi:hypothetical protein